MNGPRTGYSVFVVKACPPSLETIWHWVQGSFPIPGALPLLILIFIFVFIRFVFVIFVVVLILIALRGPAVRNSERMIK